MEVNDLLVEKLARLANLSFEEKEKQEIRLELEKMISFIEKLKELDTEGVQPLRHMSSNPGMLRDDIVQGSISRETALKNAPETDGIFFKVPKVIKK